MIHIEKISLLRGEISVGGDKSISHRAVMISSIAKGDSLIRNLLESEDCRATIDAFKNMGISVDIRAKGNTVIRGKGLKGLKQPEGSLYLGNSGTSMRLLLGILAGQDFKAILKGDLSLSKRPMKRVTRPLMLMGAEIEGANNANFAPITIYGRPLKPISHKSLIASAQVKSSIMLAGLYADGKTTVTEPYKSRDHTERMLTLFGADINEEGLTISIEGLRGKELKPRQIDIPADISSAAFFIVLGTIVKDAEINIIRCGINPTRTGVIKVLKDMGADIELVNKTGDFEPVADIIVRSSTLKAVKVLKEQVPFLIDEIPLIALCATQAEGTTLIEGIGELRVKETDRVNSILTNLKAFGADIEVGGDTFIIKGPKKLQGASVESFCDHRTAMMSIIAGCIADNKTVVSNTDCIATSFPNFMNILKAHAK
jgi:3-phosphoshikimate 1-carboxyvinyltransferase